MSVMTPLLRWRDNLSLEVPAIDKDHRKLIDLLNRVHFVHMGGDDHSAVAGTISDLLDYTRYHFAREEMLMRLAGYPGLAAHQALHAALTRRMEDFAAAFERDPDHFSVLKLYEFLADWLVDHILGQDLQIKPYVERLTAPTAA